MPSLTALAPRLVQRARADQIATLFTQWPVATGSMILGAAILITVMWGTVAPRLFAGWMGAIIVNQAWRLWLVRRYRAAAPEPVRRARWGRAWAVGSTLAGRSGVSPALSCSYPAIQGIRRCSSFASLSSDSRRHQPHRCLQGVAVRLRAAGAGSAHSRVAMEGDQLTLHRRGHAGGTRVHSRLRPTSTTSTQSLAIRYENVDLIAELQAQTAAADHARGTAEAANRGKT
jgi:hypothetical protein